MRNTVPAVLRSPQRDALADVEEIELVAVQVSKVSGVKAFTSRTGRTFVLAA
jgi:hypothetical protein